MRPACSPQWLSQSRSTLLIAGYALASSFGEDILLADGGASLSSFPPLTFRERSGTKGCLHLRRVSWFLSTFTFY